MIKLLQITGFYLGKDKFGNETYTIDGVTYDAPKGYVGHPTKRVWIRANILKIESADIGKTLWVMYNEKGWTIKAEVK